jgi:hypothetical protein
MMRRGSKVALLPLIGLALSAVPGCKKDEPPKPDPAAAAAESPSASAKMPSRHAPRNGPFNRPDPAVIKDYRIDVCYYGTLSLRQARDAYLASMGKDEPSAKKIPNFGMAPPTPAAAASGSAAAAPPKVPPPPPTPPKPAAAVASGSASAAAPAVGASATAPSVDHKDLAMRIMHERYARSCSSAVPLKEPAMGDVDAQVAAFAPFAVELAKDVTAAEMYYQKEEYTKDNFAKGKEFDKKLREGFAKLDELSDKLGNAVEIWRKDHPADASKWDEGEKISRSVIDDARTVLMAVVHKKADGEAWKAAVDKLDKSSAALKAFADGHATDNWSKIMAAPVEAFVKVVKEAKVTHDKGFESGAYLQLVSSFSNLLDSKQRAVSRALRPPMSPPPGEAAAHPPPAAAPAPAPAEPPK